MSYSEKVAYSIKEKIIIRNKIPGTKSIYAPAI